MTARGDTVLRLYWDEPSQSASVSAENLLPGHALLNPLVAATMFLPGGAGAFEGAGRVGHLLHPLVTDFGEPQFDGLGLGAGDALDEAQQGLGIGDIGKVALAVSGR